MSRTLRIVERARTDVDGIFNWLVHRSVRGAISWYLAFGRAVEKIAASPDDYVPGQYGMPIPDDDGPPPPKRAPSAQEIKRRYREQQGGLTF